MKPLERIKSMMVWQLLFAAMLVTLTANIAKSQVDRLGPLPPRDQQVRQFISDLYLDYYRRSATPAEIEVWMRGYRNGESLDEIHAAFIGSEEFFNASRRDETTWINNLFLALANRNPTSQETNYWIRRLWQLNGDRRSLAREFLQTQMGGSAPGLGNLPSYNSLPSQLVSTSQQLAQSIRSDFGGWNSTVLQLQANNLVQVATQSQPLLENAARDPSRARLSLQNLDVAVQGLNSRIQTTSGGNASRYYLDQVNRIMRALGDQLPASGGGIGGPVYPPIYPPNQDQTLSRSEARRISRLVDSTSRELQRTYTLIRDIARYDYRYSALSNDTNYVLNELQNLGNSIYEGYSKSAMRRALDSIQAHVQNLNGRIRGPSVDARVSQAWYDFVDAYNQLNQEVGVNQPGNAGFTPPNWNQIQAIQREIDRALAMIDQLLQRYTPFYYLGGSYAQLVADLRALRSSLLSLRAHLSENTGNVVFQNDWNEIKNQYGFLSQRVDEIGRSRGMFDTPDIGNLSTTLQEIGRLTGLQ